MAGGDRDVPFGARNAALSTVSSAGGSAGEPVYLSPAAGAMGQPSVLGSKPLKLEDGDAMRARLALDQSLVR
jgi:hypothetical protein